MVQVATAAQFLTLRSVFVPVAHHADFPFTANSATRQISFMLGQFMYPRKIILIFAMIGFLSGCGRNTYIADDIESIDIGYMVHSTNIAYHVDRKEMTRRSRIQGSASLQINKGSSPEIVKIVYSMILDNGLKLEPYVPNVSMPRPRNGRDNDAAYGVVIKKLNGDILRSRIPFVDMLKDGKHRNILDYLDSIMPVQE